MALRAHPDGAYEVMVYDPAFRRKVYVGRFRSLETAREVEALAKRGEYQRPSRQGSWTLAAKGEVTCRRCGEPATHLHHLVPRASGVSSPCSARGGLPLCSKCHMGWHHRAVTIFREDLMPEEVAFVIGAMGNQWLATNYPARHSGLVDPHEALSDEVVRLRSENRRLRARLTSR